MSPVDRDGAGTGLSLRVFWPGGKRSGRSKNLLFSKFKQRSPSSGARLDTPAGQSTEKHSDPTNQTNQSGSLWDQAYNTLKQDSTTEHLVSKYECLLIQQFGQTAPGETQPMRLEKAVELGLQQMEEKGKYHIGKHEFNLRNQIAEVGKVTLWAKEYISHAVEVSPEASTAWAAICLFLPLLTNPKAADEASKEGLDYVTSRLQWYVPLEPHVKGIAQKLGMTVEMTARIVPLYQRLLEFQMYSVLRYFSATSHQLVRDFVSFDKWKKMLDQIKALEEDLKNDLEGLTNIASTEALSRLEESCNKALQATTELLTISEQTKEVAKKHLEHVVSSDDRECRKVFSGTNYRDYKELIEVRLDGTCVWLLDHPDFLAWLQKESVSLLISADPGCGKSVLTKYLIDEGLPKSAPSASVCYFFFRDSIQTNVSTALCALIAQLLDLHPALMKHARTEFDKLGSSLPMTVTALWDILSNIRKDPASKPMILVLDALDECDDVLGLIKGLGALSREGDHGQMKWLLTCRPYPPIMQQFTRPASDFPLIQIHGEGAMESSAISKEVDIVIKHRVDHGPFLRGGSRDQEVKDRLIKHLCGSPQRTYLYMDLVFKHIQNEGFDPTPEGLTDALETLPRTINEAYEKILRKINSNSTWKRARRALSIVLAARRPLTLSEMIIALNIQPQSRAPLLYTTEDEQVLEDRLRTWFGLLVSIHDKKIFLLHQTVREFLLINDTLFDPTAEGWYHSISDYSAQTVLQGAVYCT